MSEKIKKEINEKNINTEELYEPKHYAGGDGLYFKTDTTPKEKITLYEIKELARRTYQELHNEQGMEGFPESSSFIYGFIKGYKEAEKK